MDNSLDTLIVLAEITTAFVAFAVIVASLRVSFGGKLSPFQLLLVHFFTESGMLSVTFSLVPLVLYQFWPDELLVATATTWYAFIMVGAYFFYYLKRRRKITAPTPFLSMINIVCWSVWIVILGLTLSGYFWSPSIAIITALAFWGLFSATIIFVSLLTSFLDWENTDTT